MNLKISVSGLEAGINSLGATTVLTSGDLMDENSFDKPNKVMINENSIRYALEIYIHHFFVEHFIHVMKLPLFPSSSIREELNFHFWML